MSAGSQTEAAPEPRPARILLIEDVPPLVEGLINMLAVEGRFAVVHSAANLVDARSSVTAFDYDAVLLDLELPERGGDEKRTMCGPSLIPLIRQHKPDAKIVAFSNFLADRHSDLLVRLAGIDSDGEQVDGFASKSDTMSEITKVLGQVLEVRADRVCSKNVAPLPRPSRYRAWSDMSLVEQKFLQHLIECAGRPAAVMSQTGMRKDRFDYLLGVVKRKVALEIELEEHDNGGRKDPRWPSHDLTGFSIVLWAKDRHVDHRPAVDLVLR